MKPGQPLSGKKAVVTGSSRGIGRAIAIRLAREGARVVLAARDAAALDEACGTIRSAGGEAHCLALDLRLPGAPARLAGFAVEILGGIDIVVNNAGATRRGTFESLTDEDWTDGFALKFFGAVRLTHAAWPHLKRSHGAVLFISGVGGRTPGPQFAVGGSVNAALLSLTKALAAAGLDEGIRVNTINPGTIRTQRFQSRLEALARERSLPLAEAEAEFVRDARVSRIGEPEDVAALAAFVSAPRGACSTAPSSTWMPAPPKPSDPHAWSQTVTDRRAHPALRNRFSGRPATSVHMANGRGSTPACWRWTRAVPSG